MAAKRTPNILFLLTDQLTVTVLNHYAAVFGDPHRGRYAKTPNLDRLAARGVVFDHCYCQSPLCVPSRASLCSGRLPSRVGSFDNATELPTATPTLMHALRAGGYRTVLSGKMHFIGLDQLHGFEERLTPDIYPTTLEWTPDWRRGLYLNRGACVKKLRLSANSEKQTTAQMYYDNHVHRVALKHIDRIHREQKNGTDRRPFFLCVSWTHPHDPFKIPAKYFNRCTSAEIPPPAAGSDPAPAPYQQWINTHHGVKTIPPSAAQVQAARHAYYGMVNYLDEMVGQWLKRLDRLGLTRNTIVVLSSDHGEMLGEHGMWFKRTFHEPSIRVPLIVAHPQVDRRLQGTHNKSIISLIDLFPTFCEWATIKTNSYILDGASFAKLLKIGAKNRQSPAYSEYLAEGTVAPMRALRVGRWKYVYVHAPVAAVLAAIARSAAGGRRRLNGAGRSQPHELLFDLTADPLEQKNLAGDHLHQKILADLRRQCFADGWDPEKLTAAVLQSQEQRLQVLAALVRGPNDRAIGFSSDALFWGAQPTLPVRN